MKAMLKNYDQAPRKVRLVANLIRGKSIVSARQALMFLPKKSAADLNALLNSAIANADQAYENLAIENLFVKTITVDKGMTLKRVRPFKQGRAGRIHKIKSTIRLELGARDALLARAPQAETPAADAEAKSVPKPAAKKTAKKSAKKAVKRTS